MARRKRWWILVGGILVLAGALGWRAHAGASGEPGFSAEPVRRGDLRETVTANGEIQARTRVNVGTTVSGEIKEIHVREGQEVRPGDLLVTLDQERFRQDLHHAELGLRIAQQEQAQAAATAARQEEAFRRKEALHRQGLLASEEFQEVKLVRDNAATALEKARMAVQQAEAQAAVARDALDKTVLRAAMGGRVTGLKAEKGETAIAGQTNIAGALLMVISDMTELVMEAKVGEQDVVKLRPGQPAEVQVDALPGRVFAGRVLGVGSSGGATNAPSGPEALNYRVRVQLQGEARELADLRPGMGARVAVLAREVKQVLTVPLAAIQERDERTGLGLLPRTRISVFVLKGGRAEERLLRLGVETRRAVEVEEGLQEGDLVLTGPSKALATLRPGSPVRLAAGGGRP